MGALSKQVEMFQWIEQKSSTEKDTKSGGKEKTTTYSYKEDWSLTIHDSKDFQNKQGHENPAAPGDCKPTGIFPERKYADDVTFGKFYLPQELKQKCFKDAPCTADELKSAKGPTVKGKEWRVDKEYFTTVKGGKAVVGDFRIKFRKVPCGDATVMAVQVTDSVNKRPSFVAYMNNYHTEAGSSKGVGAKVELPPDVERPLLPGGQENKKDVKSMKKMIAESDEGCCNICRTCDALIEAHEEIFHIEQKHLSGAQMMKAIMSQQNLIHKLITIVGYCVIVGGLYMMLQFVPALFRIIPFVGSWVQYFGDIFMEVVAFVLGTFLALVTIALAWLRYHPKFALMVLALAVVVLFGPTVYGHVMGGQ